jgi:hypothetical protein
MVRLASSVTSHSCHPLPHHQADATLMYDREILDWLSPLTIKTALLYPSKERSGKSCSGCTKLEKREQMTENTYGLHSIRWQLCCIWLPESLDPWLQLMLEYRGQAPYVEDLSHDVALSTMIPSSARLTCHNIIMMRWYHGFSTTYRTDRGLSTS